MAEALHEDRDDAQRRLRLAAGLARRPTDRSSRNKWPASFEYFQVTLLSSGGS